MNPILIIVGIGLLIALVGGKRQRSQTVVVGALPPGGAQKGPTAVGQFDPEAARALVVPFAQDCAEFQNGYDEELCRAFQGACGIEVDGDYNPETAGALEYWLKKTGNDSAAVPPSKDGKVQYFPPGASVNELPAVGGPDDNAAAHYAPICAEAVSVGRGYRDDPLRAHCVRTFQLAAGLVVDGLYGPKTRDAAKKWVKATGVNVPVPVALYGR